MEFTPDSYRKFKRAYNKAIKNNKRLFDFDGQPIDTGYAKYLIEYNDQNPKLKIK